MLNGKIRAIPKIKSRQENTIMPRTFENMYPLSKKPENSLFVIGKNNVPSRKITSQNLKTNPKSKKYIQL